MEEVVEAVEVAARVQLALVLALLMRMRLRLRLPPRTILYIPRAVRLVVAGLLTRSGAR